MNIDQAIRALRESQYDETIQKLYPDYKSDPEKYLSRFESLLRAYRDHFPEPACFLLRNSDGVIR